jgi:hypothetical protein
LRIKEAKQGLGIIAIFTEKAKELQQAKQEILGSQNSAVNTEEMEQSQEVIEEHSEEQIEEQKDDSINSEEGIDSGSFVALTPEIMGLLQRYPKIAALFSTSQRTATFKEVADATGYSEKWLRSRVQNKAIKVASRNKNRIIITSVISWLKTQANESAKPLQNGHQKTASLEGLTELETVQ